MTMPFPSARRLLPLLLAALAPAFFAGDARAERASPAVRTPAAVQAVRISDFAFVPAVLVVAPGTTVTWTNADEDPHTIVANARAFRSVALDTEDRFSFTFATPGDYAYFCRLYPHMTGRIIVRAG